MKIRIIFLLCFVICFAIAKGGIILQKFDRSAYYEVLRTGKTDDINNQLSALSASPLHDKDAFEGALLMRKAGLVKIPAEKLKFFKSGRIKLETVIAKDSTNAEFRFLRLIIQEHAPKIVKYNQQLETDKLYIQKHFKALPAVVQDAIADYSKTSTILTLPANR